MIINPIKTRVFIPPKDDLFALLKESLSPDMVSDNSVVIVTSKIVSIGQGRCIKIDDVKDKDKLIEGESDLYLPRDKVPAAQTKAGASLASKRWEKSVMLTIKDNIMIPTSGIDESNAADYYILWPERPFEVAKEIYTFLKNEFNLKNFGVIISDSHTVPLRWGTMGIALSYWGFYPLKDYRGTKDIFGREMKISQLNIADSLATAGVLAMGEGNEQTPIAVVNDIPSIKFGDFDFEKENPLAIAREEDIYGPLLNNIEWEKGGNSVDLN